MKNINNFRNVKGYINKDNKKLKANMIFRGGALNRLIPDEINYFEKKLNIRYVLDFRDQNEAEKDPDIIGNRINYERISALQLQDERFQGFDFGKELSKHLSLTQIDYLSQYLLDGYKNMPFNNNAFDKLFKLLLKNDGSVYYHCSAGKDRTGIATFLIMMALDMNEEDAINEYLLSNKYLKNFIDQFYLEHNVSKEFQKLADKLLYVREENILLAINAIKCKYQSYDDYFEKEYNLTKEKRKLLKAIYCE
jgi:protein-tyrosine phosphatase